MIMTTLTKAVHRGSDGSVHYLASNPEASYLLITWPGGQYSKIELDGPCRLVKRNGDLVEYLSIGPTLSTSVEVRPGEPPFITELGTCDYCMFDAAGVGHDFSLWPFCPSGGPHRGRDVEQGAESVRHDVAASRDERFAVYEDRKAERKPDRAPEPDPEPSRGRVRLRSLFGGSSSEPVPDPEPEPEPVRVRARDPQFTPAPTEEVTRPGLRWGGPAGYW